MYDGLISMYHTTGVLKKCTNTCKESSQRICRLGGLKYPQIRKWNMCYMNIKFCLRMAMVVEEPHTLLEVMGDAYFE